VFYKKDASGYRSAVPGVSMKTLVHGENSLCTEFRLEAGHLLPMHAHVQEQTGYLISGAIRLTIGDETFTVEPGDSWCIPGNVMHGAQILSDSVAIEVFAPIRTDYLPGN
jgi:quercetin dioxygenase-like cupin family protein